MNIPPEREAAFMIPFRSTIFKEELNDDRKTA